MRDDIFSLMLGDGGCHPCGARGDVFYAVSFYALPARLRRKRHRDREWTGGYCRPCYEAAASLRIAVGGGERTGRAYAVPTTPRQEVPDRCLVCGASFRGTGQFYGLIASHLIMGGSIIESLLSAMLRGDCVERHWLELPGTLEVGWGDDSDR